MIFYWENFGHLARAEQDISPNADCYKRLLDIIMDENSDAQSYVNMKNKHPSVYIRNRRICMKLMSEYEVRFLQSILFVL